MTDNIFRWLPGVDEVLLSKDLLNYAELPRVLVVGTIREVLAEYRNRLSQQGNIFSSEEQLKNQLIMDVCSALEKKSRPVLRSVINATGVVLHTNLGRAVLSGRAREAVDMVAAGYSNLELNLDTGLRGSRYAHVEELLLQLTGAEAALVVNNNAAAVLLALDTLAKGKQSIVSRGQLVEIGGAFRIPEVMERSGSMLIEVGATNKTHLKDYENAITSETGLILKVHTSNYRVVGFTAETSLADLVALGRKYQIPVMEDLGSGSILDLKIWGVGDEPTVAQTVAAGADVVTFSGDKLLGGPQAGIIVGREKYISLMKKNPLNRALRIDKMTIAALEATLRSHLDLEKARLEIPTLEMLTRSTEEIKAQAVELSKLLQTEMPGVEVKVAEGKSAPGGGSLPTTELPTWLVMVKPLGQKVETITARLREGDPAVLVYVREDWIVLDPRTIFPVEYLPLARALKKAAGGK